MGFADSSVCPSCLGRIDHAARCPHCGLDLTTHEVQQVWQALVVADQWVERARSLQSAGVPTAEQPASSPTAPAPQHPPAAPQPPQRRGSISTGAVLLGLGALFILVAGTIFISVSWGSLGVLGRALVLLAVTALIGGLGWFVTRRGLRASSEAVWSVFFGLLTLDWFAARAQGLAGLDTWPFGVSASVWAVLVIGAALVVVPTGRRSLSKELLAPSIVAGAAAWFAAGSLAAEVSDETADTEFWPAVLATAVAAAAGLVLRRGSMRVGMWICLAGAGFFGLFAIGFAVAEAVQYPSLSDLVPDAHGLALLLVVVAAVVCGVLVDRARIAASAVAVAGVMTLISLPIEEAWPERGGYVVVAGLLAAAAWSFTGAGPWFQGARVTVVVGGSGLVLATTPWVGRLLVLAGEGVSAPRTVDLATRLHPDDALEVGPWWLVLVVTAALAAVLVAARRWPEADEAREHLTPVAWCVGVLGAVAAPATFDLPAASIGGAVVAGGALLAVVLAKPVGWRWVGPAVVALAPLATISSWPATVIVWPAAALVLAVVAVRTEDVILRAGGAFAAVGWGLGTVAPALELIDGDDRWTALALVVAGLVGLAVALFAVRDDLAHLAVEIASTLLGVVGIAIGSTVSTTGFASFTWTIAGVGIVVLGLTSSRRAWYRWVGSGLLGVAYVLRLAASDVEVVEAYTLPFAAFLLAVGLWAMRDENGPGSVRALLPGVALALLPSLPQALDEPTGLRALLLGVGAAVALAVGTWRRWQVPFVAGALVLALLVLVNVGPPALALPRWVLIASAGALLLAAGITWDDRVRDGRAVIRYVGSMR